MQLADATYRANNRRLRIRKTTDDPRSRQIEVRLDGGAWAEVFEMDETRTPEDFQLAVLVAAKVYGTNRRTGHAACTNSMTHDIWNAMRDIAGC